MSGSSWLSEFVRASKRCSRMFEVSSINNVQIVMFIPYFRHKFTVNANNSVSACVCVHVCCRIALLIHSKGWSQHAEPLEYVIAKDFSVFFQHEVRAS